MRRVVPDIDHRGQELEQRVRCQPLASAAYAIRRGLGNVVAIIVGLSGL